MLHSKQFVTNLDSKCIQPNAVDLRIDKLFEIYPTTITITETTKDWCRRQEVVPVRPYNDQQEFFCIGPGRYEFETEHTVTIPEGAAGWLITRSTLARNGILIGNGLYDAGYSGVIGGVLHVPMTLNLERGARIAQFIMSGAETSHLYDGYYNSTNGETR